MSCRIPSIVVSVWALLFIPHTVITHTPPRPPRPPHHQHSQDLELEMKPREIIKQFVIGPALSRHDLAEEMEAEESGEVAAGGVGWRKRMLGGAAGKRADSSTADNDNVNELMDYFIRPRSRRLPGEGLVCVNKCYCFSKATKKAFCCDCMTGPCFPSTAALRRHNTGEPINMGKVKVGDLVSTVKDGALVGSKVVGFLDKRPDELAEYLYITSTDGSTITISSGHVIYVVRDNGTKYETVYAKDVLLGDKLVTVNKADTSQIETNAVVEIKRDLFRGAFVPLTEDGNMLVNNVLVSCYSSFPHRVSHVITTPIRWFPHLFLSNEDGVNIYVKWLKYLGKLMLPKYLLASSNKEVEKFESESEYYQQIAVMDKARWAMDMQQCPRISE